MNRSRILTILTIALVAVLPAVAHASSDIPGRGSLPDNRGYELVSPVAKNGGDVLADSGRVRASVSGDAVGFASLTAFGDTLGAQIATEYLSQRTGAPGTRGWQTHGIFPQLNPLSYQGAFYGKDTIYQEEFSEDLSKGVLHSYTPLTEDPAVAKVSNLYLRSDLLSAGPGSYALLSSCPACTPSAPVPDPSPSQSYLPMVAATTPDLGHVLFEGNRNLTADAPAFPPFPASLCNDNPFLPYAGCPSRLYESDHGSLRLAGILPDGSAAPISIAGMKVTDRRGDTLNTISDDGSKIFFTVPPNNNEISGDLYMRLDHTSTVKLNASQRTDCADQSPCTGTLTPDPAGPGPATYQIASADGSKVFFFTNEQLTDTPGGNLYVYDTTLPVSDPDHLRRVFIDQQPDDGATGISGVLGASSDGSYVYFLDQSALLPGQPNLPVGVEIGIYAWHQGTISFVGSVNDPGNATVSKGWPGLLSRVTPDGVLLFVAQEGTGLAGYGHSTTNCGGISCTELYRYRPDSGQLSCVSCNPTGATATAGATFVNRANSGGTQSASHLNHPITDDGNRVYFDSGERLLPTQDVNGKKHDVYQWTAANTNNCTPTSPGYRPTLDGCLALLTTGTSTDDSYFLDANPTGRDVFFTTNQSLVGWDTDDSWDLYDARVDGGLPNPTPPETECAVDACQGTPHTSPETPLTPGSATLTSTGNAGDGRNARAVISGLGMVSVGDRARLARGETVRVRLRVDRAGTVSLSGVARVGGKNRRVGSSSVKASRAGAVSIPFALTPSARKALQRKRSLSVSLTTRFADARPKVLTLALRAPAAKKRGGS